MKIFLKRVLVFIIGAVFTIILFYYGVDYFYNVKKTEDALFIWGDSQAYLGFDLEILRTQTKKKVYSAAEHGAGVYDFLVFTENVPKNATVIISLSKLVQVRRKMYDKNLSNISLKALWKLYKHHYSPSEIITIIRKNEKPKNLFRENTELLPYADTIKIDIPLSRFQSYYLNLPTFLEDKQELFWEGINTLKNKNCKIILVEFPYHPFLQEVENNSPIKNKTEAFKLKVHQYLTSSVIDTLQLDTNKNVMSDLSHLNVKGAQSVSSQIIDKLDGKSKLLIVNWRNLTD